ncbi:MAG: hypothetical protein NTV54_04505 [Ignavibacteriales bacterium]|nr:hypothetical protein [Ignavibacteriales bacterium]
MGLGQMLLTILSTMLLGKVILTINQSTLLAGQTKDMAEYRITATSLGTSMLEQTNAASFDQVTATMDVLNPSSLTAVNSLGPEGSETIATYNDIDDFNNYMKMDSIKGSAIFKTRVKVDYVQVSGGTIAVAATQTWSKRVKVYVTSTFLEDTLVFQSIYSYWFFR